MNQKKIFIILFVIVVVGVIGFFVLINNPTPTPTTNNGLPPSTFNQSAVQNLSVEGKILEITLGVGAPFSTAKLSIYDDGSALYVRKQDGQQEAQTIHEAGTFTQTQMAELFDLIGRNNFLSLKDRPYKEGNPVDGSTYAISVTIRSPGPPELVDAAVHSVSCYQFECEQSFLVIKNFIIKVYGKEILEVGV